MRLFSTICMTLSHRPTMSTCLRARVTAVCSRLRVMSIGGPENNGSITMGNSLPWLLCMEMQ